jgi:hypothetical protein
MGAWAGRGGGKTRKALGKGIFGRGVIGGGHCRNFARVRGGPGAPTGVGAARFLSG